MVDEVGGADGFEEVEIDQIVERLGWTPGNASLSPRHARVRGARPPGPTDPDEVLI